MEYKDYYDILGIDRTASQDEIKKAYRKRARKHHPDLNQGDQASAEKFKELNEAHEVLSDPEKREKYDQLGAQWQYHQGEGGKPENFNWGEWQSSPNQRSSYRTVTPEEFEEMFGHEGGYSDFFENLFGRGARHGPSERDSSQHFHYDQRARQGRDIEHDLQVTLDEAFHGTKRALEWEDGRKIEATIPRGVKTGSRVRLRGQGGPGLGGGEPGDLYLAIQILPDHRFERDNGNLSTTISVDLFTMLLGGKVPVSGIDRTVMLDIPSGTQNMRVFRLQGLGMPRMKAPDQRGDLLATAEVSLPKNLNNEEKELVKQWQRIH